MPRARRVAVLSDVHGNAPALAAVLAELDRLEPELVVFAGDLTWGPLPRETLELVRALRFPARLVRGNADRSVLEGLDDSESASWLQERHGDAERAFLEAFEERLELDVEGLGSVCVAHGSPRSDEECVTPETPVERVREFMSGVEASVVVTGHVHLQFDREVDGIRSVNPGSVGLPYDEAGSAAWALLGPDVELRRTAYDVEAAIASFAGYPGAELVADLLHDPPGREAVIEDAERRVFAG